MSLQIAIAHARAQAGGGLRHTVPQVQEKRISFGRPERIPPKPIELGRPEVMRIGPGSTTGVVPIGVLEREGGER